MTTLTIDVADLATVQASMKAAFRGVPQGCTYSFASEEQLLTTLNANRWAILKALTGAGPLGVRAPARRVGRDVKMLSQRHKDTKKKREIGSHERLLYLCVFVRAFLLFLPCLREKPLIGFPGSSA